MDKFPGYSVGDITRRKFLGQLGIGVLSASILTEMASCSSPRSVPVVATNNTPFDPSADNDTVPVPKQQLKAKSEQDQGEYHSPMNPEKRIGYALVGLGALTLGELMPAFGSCKYSKPVALVSGHRDKALKVASQYGIAEKNIYSYANFDEIKNNPEIDVVYIVLPNNMHHEFTIRAANAGKHVLCEKPNGQLGEGM